MTVGLLAFGATTASAAIVCNGAGDCWRTKERYAYPPNAGVQIYADDWKWGPNDNYRWREHEGRGYWGPEGVGNLVAYATGFLFLLRPSLIDCPLGTFRPGRN
jgi:hypothetical protein